MSISIEKCLERQKIYVQSANDPRKLRVNGFNPGHKNSLIKRNKQRNTLT